MFHRIAKFLVLIAAVQILGGHWAVLQSVAWARMLVNYAQHDSLPVAIAKTFNGAHPCDLCQAVSKGRQQEEQQDLGIEVVKLDAVLTPAVHLPARAEVSIDLCVTAPFARILPHCPPVPPPRLA